MSDQTAEEIVEKHRNYTDTTSITVTERAAIRADTDILSLNLSSYDTDELVCGVTVKQEGTNIALKGGTVPESHEALPSIYTWNGLTPAQAREIADGLYAAAERVEELADGHEVDESEASANSIINRVLGR